MLKIAAIQMSSGNNKKKNLERANTLLESGVLQGAKFLALPENFSFMGEESEKIQAAENLEDGESVEFLKEFSRKHKVWLLGGSVPFIAGDQKVTNSSLLISDQGEITARYDKIHLFDVNLSEGEVYRESGFVQKGDQPVVADTPFGKVGLSICYDLRFPELYRILALNGASMVFLPAAFTVPTGMAHWEVLIRARAIENQVYMIAAGQCGVNSPTRTTYGHSMIVDPWGKVLAAASDEEAVILADLDFDYLENVRKRIPCLEHMVLR